MNTVASPYACNRRYSVLSERLAEIVCRDGMLREFAPPAEPGSSMVEAYQYDLSRWPIFVDDTFLGKFRELIDRFQPIARKVLTDAFRRDPSGTARYLSMPESIAELFSGFEGDPSALLLRYDIVLTDGRIRIVEVNAGSSIGGWQHDWLHGEILAALAGNAEVAAWNLKYRRVTDAMLMAMAEAAVKVRAASATGNVLLFGYDPDENTRANLQRSLDRALIRLGREPKGEVRYSNALSDLAFDADGNLLCRGEIADALLLVMPEDQPLPPHIYMRLASSVMAGRLVMPDAPHQVLIGNKLLLALLHEPRSQAALSPDEVAFVRACVPWSAKIEERRTIEHQGDPIPMREMLVRDQHGLIVKKAYSLQGRHVIVGRYCDRQRWLAAIDHAMEEGDWLVQEYCSPDTFVSWCPTRGETTFELVWGVFEMGCRYGGAFVRGIPGQNTQGVINSASGAREFTVFEEVARKTMLL